MAESEDDLAPVTRRELRELEARLTPSVIAWPLWAWLSIVVAGVVLGLGVTWLLTPQPLW